MIDPIIEIWAYGISGSDDDIPYSINLDNKGNIIVTGVTYSSDLPITNYDYLSSGYSDIFILKLDSNGNSVWSTYFGGSGGEGGTGICIDSSNNILIVGSTSSSDFPGNNKKSKESYYYYGYVLKLNEDGHYIWSKLFGGNREDYCASICKDKEDYLYICGGTNSSDFSVTINDLPIIPASAYFHDAFIVKLKSNGDLVWSRLFGADTSVDANGISIDRRQNIFIAGTTLSNKIPGSAGSKFNKYNDAFIAKFSTDGNLIKSIYYGGIDFDNANSITIDSKDYVIITGQTFSPDIGANVYQKSNSKNLSDAYIAKFNNNLNYIWGTFFGGSNGEIGYGITNDRFNNLYICGSSNSPDLDVNGDRKNLRAEDGFVLKLTSDGNYDGASYFGGSDADYLISICTDGNEYFYTAGATWSKDIPLVGGTLLQKDATLYDNVVIYKLSFPVFINLIPPVFCLNSDANIPITINRKLDSAVTLIAQLSDKSGKFTKPLNIGNILTKISSNIPVHIPDSIELGSNYKIRVICVDSSQYNTEYFESITINKAPGPTLNGDTRTCLKSISTYNANYNKTYEYNWDVTGGVIQGKKDSSKIDVLWQQPGNQTIKLIENVKNSNCTKIIEQQVTVLDIPNVQLDTLPVLCFNDSPQDLNYIPKNGILTGKGVLNNKFYPDSAGVGTHKISCSITDSNGCTNQAEINITVNPSPQKMTITFDMNHLVASEGTKIIWYFNGDTVAGEHGRILYNIKYGKYTVTQTNQYGCTSEMSDVFDIINSIPEIPNDNIKIYPNPVEDELTITMPNQYNNLSIKIINLLGEEIITENLNSSDKINVKNLVTGIYRIDVSNEMKRVFGGMFVKK